MERGREEKKKGRSFGGEIGRTDFQLLAARPLMSKRNWRDGTRCAPCCVKKPKASFADVPKIKYESMEESSVKRSIT